MRYKVSEVIGLDGLVIGESIVATFGDGTSSHIPTDEENKDYQDYLAWKAELETAK